MSKFCLNRESSFRLHHTSTKEEQGMELELLHEDALGKSQTDKDDDDHTAFTMFSDDSDDSDDDELEDFNEYSDDDHLEAFNESCTLSDFNAWFDTVDGTDVTDLPFRILGTSPEDASSRPHVLTPPVMEALQAFMPLCKTSDNFLLKYSMARDGASMHTLLHHARAAKYSVLAIETADGEVMGCFTNEAWRKTWNSFGGGEAFLWKMRNSRNSKCNSVMDRARLESEIDVFPYTGENDCIQICNARQFAVGGGFREARSSQGEMEDVSEHDWGYGLSLESDLLSGTSSPCVTFGSPSLSKAHSDGSLFEIVNIELWTMTPCFTEEDAENLERGQLLLQEQALAPSNEDLNKLYG